jgi:hypothetical protein
VENNQESQEVDMVEGNNGDDGNNDEKGGEENNGGSHAMDTDPKKKETKDASTNNLNGGSNGNNGGDGMQEQIERLDALQIGSLNLNITPAGSPPIDPNLNSFDSSPFYLHSEQNLPHNDKISIDFHTDLDQEGSAWGLSPCRFLGGAVQALAVSGSSAPVGACQAGTQRTEKCRSGPSVPGTEAMHAGGRTGCEGQCMQASRSELATDAWAKHMREGAASGLPLHASDAAVGPVIPAVGLSAVAEEDSHVSSSCGEVQKIRQCMADHCVPTAAHHHTMIGNDWQSVTASEGSSVAGSDALCDSGLVSNILGSDDVIFDEHYAVPNLFNQGLNAESLFASGSAKGSKDGIVDEVRLVETSKHDVGGRVSLGMASSPRTAGNVLLTNSVTTNNSVSLSLIETDTPSHYPSLEEVIAFGGIQKPTAGVRSSTRLGSQPNADMPIMEKAMKQALIKDGALNSGQFSVPKYSIINISDSEIAKRADRLGCL